MAPGLQLFPQATSASTRLFNYNEHRDIQIGDLHSSNVDDPVAPITSGVFNLQPGCKATTAFGFSEHKYVVRGSLTVSDQNGQTFVAKAGDSFYIPRGSTITFESSEGSLLYFVAQRPPNEARRSRAPKL